MKKRFYIVLTAFIIAVLIFAGCSAAPRGNSGYSKDDTITNQEGAAPGMPEPAPSEAPVATSGSGISAGITGIDADISSILQPGVNRKIVYEGQIAADTVNFDNEYNAIMDRLIADGGYVESSSIYGTKPKEYGDPGREASMTLRVPSEKFDSFIKMLNGIGENKSSNINGKDISLQYFDTEQQLETLRTRQQRLQELMKNPSYPLEDLILVEKELSAVSAEIQGLETTKRSYDSLIDYSTVYITLHEINTIELKSVKSAEPDLGTQISNGFYGVLNVLAEIGRGLLIFLTAGAPALIVIAIIVLAIVLPIKYSNKKKAKKAAQLPPQGGSNNGQNSK